MTGHVFHILFIMKRGEEISQNSGKISATKSAASIDGLIRQVGMSADVGRIKAEGARSVCVKLQSDTERACVCCVCVCARVWTEWIV